MTFRNKILMLMIKILMVKKLFLTIRILLSNVVTFSNHAKVSNKLTHLYKFNNLLDVSVNIRNSIPIN